MAGRAVAMAMEEVNASRGRSHIRDSRSSVIDRQRREEGTDSPEKDLAERAKAARRRPGFSYYLQPEGVAPDQAPNRGPGIGW